MDAPGIALPWHVRLRAAVIDAGPLVVLLLFAAVAGLLYAAYRVLDPTPAKRIVIATGPDEGAYGEFAKRYVPWLQQNGLTVELRATQGSGENLALLRDPASGVQAAFVQGGVEAARPADAQAGGAAVVSLGSVAYEPLWLFYRTDSARQRLRGAPLASLGQLAGWRINTGPAGGGTGPLFKRLAAANGLEPEAMQLASKPAVGGVVDLVQGQIDALAMVSAADAPLVQFLLRTPGVRLFDFAQAEAYGRRFTFLRPLVLPRGVVDLARDQPPQDVRLVAATASLVARADLHPALVQLLLQAARHVHGEAGWFAGTGEFPNAMAGELPLAPEAERFYRNGPPWLQRYLPFWLANFVDRMWIVILPLLAVLVPLSRVLPPLVTLRLRSRVFRWYAHLRAIEHEVELGKGDTAALQAELDRIDAQVEQVKVPLAYAHELYALRNHIQWVRGKLGPPAGRAGGQPSPEAPAA
jgi:TRAP-type uncharacterized transport system substrate-binding protein